MSSVDPMSYELHPLGEDLKGTLLVDFGNGLMGQYLLPHMSLHQEMWHEMPDGSKILAAPGKLIGARLTFSGMMDKDHLGRVWKSDYKL